MDDKMQFLAPFNGHQLQTTLLIIDQAAAAGVNPAELHAELRKIFETMKAVARNKAVDEAQAAEKMLRQAGGRRPVCPSCGGLVRIEAVNVSRCTAIGGAWKSALSCQRRECRWTELSEKSMSEWVAEMRGQGRQ